ncbi:MAG: hypothetical protein ABJK37_03835 [Paraglaciecola sp.]|uniref:hypothetical protein n=1 Tax=Paraglaciecola sp. TaxID=1920173 RepID=UPI003296A6DB
MKLLTAFCALYVGLMTMIPASANEFKLASDALLQGDTKLAKKRIENSRGAKTPECFELEVVYHIFVEKIETAIEILSVYESQFKHAARTHAFAAEAWRSIGHQVNIFRKRGYYNKALQAKLQAGVAINSSPKNMVMRASALGQTEEISHQQKLTQEIASIDQKWGYIAQINLAQNSENFTKGKKLALDAIANYPNDFFVNERVAQYYWTIGDETGAQRYFLRACKNRVVGQWYDNVKWLNSCQLVVHFTDEKGLAPEAAISALTVLLSEFTLFTYANVAHAKQLLRLAEPKNSKVAADYLNRVIKSSSDSKLVNAAKLALKF